MAKTGINGELKLLYPAAAGYDLQKAVNLWAGTTNKDLLGALNAKLGTTGRDMAYCLRQLGLPEGP